MKYRIGQKVVYIGPDFRGHWRAVLCRLWLPVPNGVYTIRAYAEDVFLNTKDGPFYWMEEGVSPLHSLTGLEQGAINEYLLRPLQERSTEAGMEILRGILDGKKVREPA